MTWEEEYRRRASEVLAPEHAEHGFVSEKVAVESHRSFDGAHWVEITVSGQCPCGEWASGMVDEAHDVAWFLEAVTKSEADL